jgi:NADPH2:quinone reductase
MRALLIEELHRSPRLADLDEPTPGQSEVLLRVVAAPLNPVDISIATGNFFAGHPALPYVPGVEAVARVERSGARPPDLVFTCLGGLGTSRNGSCAELATASADSLIPVPDGIDPSLAAAVGTAGLAAWLPLTRRAPVAPGESVLVLGATGTAGLVAVQAARLLGAARVVAAGRRPEGLERALRSGADAAVEIADAVDLADAFRRACGNEGPTLVFDPLCGEPLAAALEVAAPRARIIQLGQGADGVVLVRSALVRGKNLDILGYTNFNVPFETLADGYGELVGHVRDGRIRLDVETVPLEDGVIAWEKQKAGPGGKLVLRP